MLTTKEIHLNLTDILKYIIRFVSNFDLTEYE